MNYQKLYPEINLSILEQKARTWATKRYPGIERILLFRSHVPELQYILVAEIRNLDAEIPHLQDIPEPKKKAEFAKFRNDWSDPTCLHIRDDLINVLKTEKPSSENVSQFLDQWLCYAKTSEEELLEDLVDVESVKVLYGGPNDESKDTEKKEFLIENLIEKAIPEIGRIMQAIITFVGWTNQDYDENEEGPIEDKWRDEALDYFDDNEEEFSIITREYLEEIDYYTLRRTNESRDFRGKLLQKMIQDRFPNEPKYGIDRLNKKYKKYRENLDRSRHAST
jgi:hypothetical protein